MSRLQKSVIEIEIPVSALVKRHWQKLTMDQKEDIKRQLSRVLEVTCIFWK